MQNHPKTLTTIEAEKIIEQLSICTNTKSSQEKAIRNKLIGLLLLDAGLRVGELTKLEIGDLTYGGQPVINIVLRAAITKKQKERSIPLTARVQRSILAAQENYWSWHFKKENDYAFYGRNPEIRITTRQVERIIKEASLRAIGKPTHPHILRHTFASRLMRIANIRVVQELLGHKSLQTTQIYTHPNSDDLATAIEGLNYGQKEEKEATLQNAEGNLAD
jgi:site-specific recombinase XerD